MNAIGIDIGTSGCKGVLVSFPDGTVLQSARRSYTLHTEGVKRGLSVRRGLRAKQLAYARSTARVTNHMRNGPTPSWLQVPEVDDVRTNKGDKRRVGEADQNPALKRIAAEAKDADEASE